MRVRVNTMAVHVSSKQSKVTSCDPMNDSCTKRGRCLIVPSMSLSKPNDSDRVVTEVSGGERECDQNSIIL